MSHQWIMTGVYKYFSGFSGEVYLNISPAPEKYYLSDTSPAPEKPGKYLKTPFPRRRSIYTHFSGSGEVLICTYLAPEKQEKPEKYLYTPGERGRQSSNDQAIATLAGSSAKAASAFRNSRLSTSQYFFPRNQSHVSRPVMNSLAGRQSDRRMDGRTERQTGTKAERRG